MKSQPLINLLIADDHTLTVAGIRKSLERSRRCFNLSTADQWSSILASLRFQSADIVILDISLKAGPSGVEIISNIKRRWPDTKILIYSYHIDIGHVLSCFRAGAEGFYAKSQKRVALYQAVENILDGEKFISPCVSAQLLAALAAMPTDSSVSPFCALSSRQFELCKLLAANHSNAQIGTTLSVSKKTVANNVSQIKSLLGIRSRTELAGFVRRHL